MPWPRIVIGLALIAVSVLGVWVRLAAARLLLRSGQPVRATVIGACPGGVNQYPPYGSWEPRIEVTYDLGGKRRKASIWLEKTKHTDYQEGQEIEVFASGRLLRRLRTEAEQNIYGGIVTGMWLFCGMIGAGLVIWGLARLIGGP